MHAGRSRAEPHGAVKQCADGIAGSGMHFPPTSVLLSRWRAAGVGSRSSGLAAKDLNRAASAWQVVKTALLGRVGPMRNRESSP